MSDLCKSIWLVHWTDGSDVFVANWRKAIVEGLWSPESGPKTMRIAFRPWRMHGNRSNTAAWSEWLGAWIQHV